MCLSACMQMAGPNQLTLSTGLGRKRVRDINLAARELTRRAHNENVNEISFYAHDNILVRRW